MAKISKKTIDNLREFLDRGCDYAGTQEELHDMVTEIMDKMGAPAPNCWDELYIKDDTNLVICVLEDFAEAFWDAAVERFLNVLGTEE